METEKLGWDLAFVQAVDKDNAIYHKRDKPRKVVKLIKAKKWSWQRDSLDI